MSSLQSARGGNRAPKTQHKAWITLVVTGLVLGAAFIAVYVGLQRSPEPLHLPIAIAGEQLASAAEHDLGGKAAVTEVPSLAEGAKLVRDGDAVAAAGLSAPTTLQVDYAGAKGLSESAAARGLLQGVADHAGLTVSEQDLVPLVKYDGRGLSAFYVVFGVTLSSFVLAQGLTAAAGKIRLRHRLYAIGGFAVVIGLVAATIAGPLLGALTAPWPALALTLSLMSAAVAFTTKALGAWLGGPGISLAVLSLTTVGNAVSGATIGYDILPSWAQAISAVLPPGAAYRAVNHFGYYNGSTAWSSLVVLAIWAAAGFGLVLLRPATRARKTRSIPAQPEPATVSVA
ncbi:hypothetical protein [Leifsonia sp. NPDC058248]|uniref:hypothetical protein n=1 Tax=Leifsonia sp. NPDC058248 TaxID=3346402 RepID=UPI0036D929AC